MDLLDTSLVGSDLSWGKYNFTTNVNQKRNLFIYNFKSGCGEHLLQLNCNLTMHVLNNIQHIFDIV